MTSKKESNSKRDTRAYFLTINNPQNHGYNQDILIKKCQERNPRYFCFALEQGEEEKTLHYHIFLYFENARSFNTIKKLFPGAHIEQATGSPFYNYQYIRKEGPHIDKSTTSIDGTFYEEGDKSIIKKTKAKMPSKVSIIFDMYRRGETTLNIMKETGCNTQLVNDVIQQYLKETYQHSIFENTEVIYVSGMAGTGKTHFIYDTYKDFYITTTYLHPFDDYENQKVVVFDEFHSSVAFNYLLVLTDCYARKLECRYANKLGIYENFIIISNEPLEKQYSNIQKDEPETFCALLRRFKYVRIYTDYLEYVDYSIHDYLKERCYDFHENIYYTEWMKNNHPDLYAFGKPIV